MDKKASFSPPAIGASSLLVIFAVLCLTVFALLGISTVKADTRLSENARDAVIGYYQADCEAEAILAQLRSGFVPEGVSQADDIYSYRCTISDTQVLEVEVVVENGNHRVLRWQAVSTTSWQADEKLPVWDGQGD